MTSNPLTPVMLVSRGDRIVVAFAIPGRPAVACAAVDCGGEQGVRERLRELTVLSADRERGLVGKHFQASISQRCERCRLVKWTNENHGAAIADAAWTRGEDMRLTENSAGVHRESIGWMACRVWRSYEDSHCATSL